MIAGTASNGKEAYDFLKKESVDLIIADIQMPVMTGLDLQEAIRKENLSNAYFVILSGYADFEYARRALQNECTDAAGERVPGDAAGGFQGDWVWH